MSGPVQPTSARVSVVAPDGTPGTLDADELQNAVAQGYKLQPGASAPFNAFDTANAAVTGLARGLTFGLSDVAAKSLGTATPGELNALKELHPVATGAGELAGSLFSPVNKVAAPIEGAIGATSVAGRIGAKAVGGAAIGSLMGAGNAVSESMLGDQDLTAQKLVSSVGLGAVLGGLGGGLGGAMEEAVAPMKKLLSNALEEAPGKLQDFADARWNKAGGALKSDLKKLSPEARSATADIFRKYIPEDGNLPKAFDAMEAAHDEVGKSIGAIAGAPDELGAQMQPFDSQDFLGKLNPSRRRVIGPEVEGLMQDLAQNEVEGGGFRGAHEIIGDLGKRANWKYQPGEDPLRNGLMKDLYSAAREHFQDQLGAHLDEGLQAKFAEASRSYSDLSRALGIARHGLDQMEGNSFFSLRDRLSSMAGGAIGSMVGGPVGAGVGYLASGLLSKIVREKGSAIVARLADSIAESPVLETVAKSLQAKFSGAPAAFGAFAPTLAAASAASAPHLLATHMVLASENPDYQKQAQVAGLTTETPGQTQAAMQRAHGLATVAAGVQAHDAELDKHAHSAVKGGGAVQSAQPLLGSQDFGNKRMRRDDGAAHQKLMDEVHALSTDPEAMVERVAGNLGGLGKVAPGVAASVARTATAAVQHLANLAQKPPQGPLALPWVYSDHDRHRFLEAYQVVQDPKSALKHVASGTLTPGHLAALRAVYPKLEQDMASKLAAAATSGRGVPYTQRLMVSMWLGADLDGTSSPAAIASNQAAIKAPTSKQQQPAPKPTAQGLSKLSVAERSSMPSRSRESEAAS